MTQWEEPSLQNEFLAPHIQHLARCYQELTGRELCDPALSPSEQARQVWEAPFSVVSHNVAEEPIFNYGNQTALRLFAMSWEEFTRLPSRQSAEPVHQAQRARLFEIVKAQGYIDDYRGVRIAKTGRRFWMENATVWTLHDEQGVLYGQAAMFTHWRDLE